MYVYSKLCINEGMGFLQLLWAYYVLCYYLSIYLSIYPSNLYLFSNPIERKFSWDLETMEIIHNVLKSLYLINRSWICYPIELGGKQQNPDGFSGEDPGQMIVL
jgi:hypothetical protein